MVALIVVGTVPHAAGTSVCAAAEPVAGTGPLWPRTWELQPDVTFQLRGRIDADSIWSGQSTANQETFGDLGDVVGLRRARIGAEGKLGPDHRYVMEIDLASGQVVPRDIYYAFGDRQVRGEYQVGHFREPFSLEGNTSARYFAFMERSPINLLDPARNWGVALFRETLDANSACAFGVFQAGTGPAGFQTGSGSTVGFTGRATTALINENHGERLLHLGCAFSERVPEDGVIVIKQQPRSPLLDFGDSSTSTFVPTIRIPSRFQQLVNLQFAAGRGPLWMQVEWYGTMIQQIDAGSVFYRGCHADCGYFLTGEHRHYDTSSGTQGKIHVRKPWLRGPGERDRPRGYGAWELTARFAYLDFLDADTPLGSNGQPVGTQLAQSTLGVNWYLCDRIRLMVNYTYDVPDEINTGTSVANVYATRLAMFW